MKNFSNSFRIKFNNKYVINEKSTFTLSFSYILKLLINL